jgi:hypothetical protein
MTLLLQGYGLANNQEIVPFQPGHLNELELRPDELAYLANIPKYFDNLVGHAQPGTSWTGIANDKVVCCFGLRLLWRGVAEAWLLPGVGIERNPIAVLKNGRRLMQEAMYDLGVERLQITVKVSNNTNVNFAKALYFEVESTMKRYGPEGDDYFMMVRFD